MAANTLKSLRALHAVAKIDVSDVALALSKLDDRVQETQSSVNRLQAQRLAIDQAHESSIQPNRHLNLTTLVARQAQSDGLSRCLSDATRRASAAREQRDTCLMALHECRLREKALDDAMIRQEQSAAKRREARHFHAVDELWLMRGIGGAR